MYDIIQTFQDYTFNPIFYESISFIKIYLFWNTLHYVTIQLYYKYCIPSYWYYISFTPFYTQSPHCKLLNWCFETSTKTINSISATIITWSSKFLFDHMAYHKKTD